MCNTFPSFAIVCGVTNERRKRTWDAILVTATAHGLSFLSFSCAAAVTATAAVATTAAVAAEIQAVAAAAE